MIYICIYPIYYYTYIIIHYIIHIFGLVLTQFPSVWDKNVFLEKSSSVTQRHLGF